VLGIALVGAGYAGTIQAGIWAGRSDASVIGIYDLDPARAAHVGRAYGIPVYHNLDLLVGHPQVNAVDIASPASAHGTAVRVAVTHRKHVLCQKPLALSYEEAAAMVRMCEESGVRLMVNENWRWRPWYRAARQVVQDGVLGALVYLDVAYDDPLTDDGRPRQPGGVDAAGRPLADRRIILDVAPHILDVVRFLFGQPADVFARAMSANPADARCEDVAIISLGYPGRIAEVRLSWMSTLPRHFQPDILTLEGENGTLRLDHQGMLTVKFHGQPARHIAVETRDFYQMSWKSTINHFAESLQSGAIFDTGGHDNLDTLRILFAAYESVASGRVVSLTAAGTIS
jgi:D-apiose dehydrogenase